MQALFLLQYVALPAVGGKGEKAGAIAATEGAQDSSAQWQGSQTKRSKLGLYYQFNDPNAEEQSYLQVNLRFSLSQILQFHFDIHLGSCWQLQRRIDKYTVLISV